MANKKVNIMVGLDFTADKMSIDKIRSQMDMAFKAMKINLDPASYKKAESQLKELQRIAELSLNKNTGRINFKKMDTAILNSADIASVESLNKTLLQAGVNGTESLNKIANANQHLQKGIVSSNSLLTKMGTTLSNTIRWNISASAVNAVTGELQKSYYFAKDLDRVLTNIRIVSGESAERMADFAIAANKSAKELKVSTLDYAEASLVFFQQGLNAIEVQKMTEASIIGSNITGESTEVMSNLLTSVVNGYKMATDEVLDVTDKLAAVGASTAADFNELATAMSKVASMAKSAGVPIDELNAQIATIVSVTKESPESIGTSLKTIYGRMLAFKADTKALMEDEDGETFGAPNVEAALKAYSRATGAQISLFKTTKDGKQELRDLGDVINEVGNSWDKTTDNVAKFGLATALAGSRQQNRLISLFNAWDQYKETVEVSLNAEGASLEQNQIYIDSYEGRLKGLQNAKEALYMSFTDSDGLKNFISGLTTGVELITKLSEAAGGLSAILGVAGSALVSHGMPKLLLNIDKFKDIIPKGSGGTDSEKEALEIKKQLHAIEKVHGAEVANNLRLKIEAAKEESFINKKTLQETQEQIGMMKSMAEASDKRKKSNFDALTADSSLGKEQLLLVQSQLDRYNELTEQRKKLAAIGPHKILADPDPKILKDIELTEQNIMELEVAIDEVNNGLDETARKFSKMSALSEDTTKAAADNIEEKAKRAEQIHKVTMLTQTAMMLLPSAINAATDDTKEWYDVLSSVGSMGLMLIPNLASEIISTAVATGGLTSATEVLGLVLKKAFLPLLGIGAAVAAIGLVIKWVDKSIVTFEEQKEIVDELSESVKGLQSEYDALSANTDRTADQEEYLILLDKELNIKKDLLKYEAEALEKDYFDSTNEVTGIDNSKASKIKEEIEEVENLRIKREELNKIMSADGYIANEEDINEIKKLNKEISELELSLVGSQKELQKMGKDLGEPTSRMKSLSRAIDETVYSSEELFEKNKWSFAEEVAEKIAAGEKATDGWQRGLESFGFTAEEALAILEGKLDDVKTAYDEVEDSKPSISEEVKSLEELTEEFEEVTNKLQTYNKILDEANSKEGLSAQSKKDIITKHQELLPYLDDEQELRKQLIKIISDEEETQRQAYTNMIMQSEDFFNAKIKGNDTLVKTLGEFYTADLENAKSLADAKEIVEASLIKNLSGLWAKYYNAASSNILAEADYRKKLDFGFGTDEEKAAMSAAINAIDKQREVARRFDELAKGFTSGVDFSGINLSGNKGGNSSSTKDDRKFLESLDAEIRAIKIKNDHLLKTGDLLKEQLEDAKNIEGIEGLNEQYRITGEIIANNELLLKSFKEEQDLIHKRANEIRTENSKYSNTDSWFDANAEQSVAYIELHRKGTKAQQDEMDALFGKIQKLKKAWMESAQEVNNIVDANKDLVATQDDLIAQQKELARVEYIKNHNDAYKEQQEALSYIAEIQERIVEIIRKRGEEERRILDKNHRLEMEALEKRHNKRKEDYAEELSDFQNLIQGKLDALDGQYVEEDYAENLRKERDKASELQRQIDVLSLDNSLDAKNKVAVLRKQLADQNENIAKMQQDRERTLLKESLEDQLTEFEENIAEKEEIADEWYENEVIRLEEDYKLNQIYHEKKYTDEKIYSEARQAILDGEVEVSKGRFVELSEAFEDFEDEFGKGMGILGDIIKDEFINKLDKARKVLEEMKEDTFKLLEELDSDARVPSKNTSKDNSKDTGKDTESSSSSNSNGIYMSSADFNSYRGFKMMWEVAKKANDKDYMKAMSDGAQKIRDKYKIKSDKYSYDDLKNLTYKTAKFDNGGKLTQTGTGVIDIHGSKSSPEWIFNDAQLKEILKSTVKSAMSFDLPKIPSFVNNGNSGNQYAITFDVRGNMDRSILPEVQRMIHSTIETIEFQKVKDLNKIGQFRPVK